MSRRTRRSTLARRLAAVADLTYQQALARVTEAGDAGRLPAQLNGPGLEAALALLLTEHAAGGPATSAPTAPEGDVAAEGAAILDRLVNGPATDLYLRVDNAGRVTARQRVDGALFPLELSGAWVNDSKRTLNALLEYLSLTPSGTRAQESVTMTPGPDGHPHELHAALLPANAQAPLTLVVRDTFYPPLTLTELGMTEPMVHAVSGALRPGSVVLVAGLTGSGKDTTARALVRHAGLADTTHVSELRSIDDCHRARERALGGELVVATIHGMEPRSVIERLGQLTGDAFTLPVSAVVSQGLLRRLCVTCAGTGTVTPSGECPTCHGRRVFGRVAAFEVSTVDHDGQVREVTTWFESVKHLLEDGVIATAATFAGG